MYAHLLTIILLLTSMRMSIGEDFDDGDFTKTCTCMQNSNSGYYCAAWTCRTVYDRRSVACFSGRNLVQTRHHGKKPLSEIEIGEEVLAFDGFQPTYESLYDFIHAEKSHTYEFLRLTAINPQRNSTSTIEMTSRHLIFRYGEKNAVHASNIRLNDQLMFIDGTDVIPARVINVEVVHSQGFYAPLTGSGTIILNGFVASNYAEVKNHDMAHLIMQPYRWWRTMLGPKKSIQPEINAYTGFLYYFAEKSGLLHLF